MMRSRILFAAGFLSLVPSLAFAHPGEHAHSLLAGMAHPVTGLDHVLAMLAVGIWAAQKGGRALWAWPLCFIGFMVLGGVLGMQGIALPLVEPAIAASVLVLGLLIASMAMLPMSAGAVLVAAFALFHGNAHGLEAPATGEGLLYALGFVLATAGLHGLGAAVGLFSRSHRLVQGVRLGGAVIAGIGSVLLFV